MLRASAILLALLGAVATGCAGSKVKVVARDARYPMSFTRSVYDENGRIHQTRKAERIHHFDDTFRQWSIFGGLVTLSSFERDVSEFLNKEVELHGGNAVVNLKVEGCFDWWWYFTALTLILPQSMAVTLEGDVAKIPTATVNEETAP